VANIGAVVKELRGKGLSVSDPTLGRSKAWLTGFKDPDGNSIELNEFSHPESWIARFLETNDPSQMGTSQKGMALT
jgi:hypothetical protein